MSAIRGRIKSTWYRTENATRNPMKAMSHLPGLLGDLFQILDSMAEATERERNRTHDIERRLSALESKEQ